ncbi:2OG-Fe(II) oxygenase [Schlesneria sp. T3-172]|uniref:HalD/BesD family halogenase n=1 Tax=Schlesneria sphaerica TaxID=3373610 RepID=UPI0037CC2BBC
MLGQLAEQRANWVKEHHFTIQGPVNIQELCRAFARERLVRVENFLSFSDLELLQSEAMSNLPRMVFSYIPTHKKGHTLSYENIQRHARNCVGLYHSDELREWVSSIAGIPVFPTPDGDQSSLSLLCYREAGDHINWHYDHNFYRGRHFTVLLSLANESPHGGVSKSKLMRKTSKGEESIDTSANVLVLFEGAKVLHRASPTDEGDLRIMLSMTFCTDSRISPLKEIARRVKDTAFFGLRALWD